MAKQKAKKKGSLGKIAAGVLALSLVGGALGGDEPANNVPDDDITTSISDVADPGENASADVSVDSFEQDTEEVKKQEEKQDTKAEETAKKEEPKQEVKEEPKDTGKAEQDEPSEQTPPPAKQPAEEKKPEPAIDPEVAFREKLKQYNYVCSSESDKYHRPTCRWTSKINDSNLAHFDTEEEAMAAGYSPCGTCKP